MQIINKINRTTCIIAAVVALGLAGCAHNNGKPASQSWSDSRTSKRVSSNLKESSTYKFPNVNINTDNGIVSLSGFVDTESQKKDAVQRAQSTTGVRGVLDNLTIRTMPTGRAPVIEHPKEINPEKLPEREGVVPTTPNTQPQTWPQSQNQ